jgi:hypothetical protein
MELVTKGHVLGNINPSAGSGLISFSAHFNLILPQFRNPALVQKVYSWFKLFFISKKLKFNLTDV